MLKSFVAAELGDLWDAEREILRILPRVAARLRDAHARSLVLERIPLSEVHERCFRTLLELHRHPEKTRACARVRQLAGDCDRVCNDACYPRDSVLVSKLLRTDEYSLAACILASRCAEAIADISTVLALAGIIAEKHASRAALLEHAARSEPTGSADSPAGARHCPRRWPDDDWQASPISALDHPRHSPSYANSVLPVDMTTDWRAVATR
jgi:ferritin-like metal-binding protein YciE